MPNDLHHHNYNNSETLEWCLVDSAGCCCCYCGDENSGLAEKSFGIHDPTLDCKPRKRSVVDSLSDVAD